MRVALLQMRSGTDPVRNVASLRDGVAEAASRGARYVQTPEMTGLVQRDRSALLDAATRWNRDPCVLAASELAGRHGVWLHIGSTAVLTDRGDRVANRAFLFGPDGTMRASYDKLHLFDVDLEGGESWRESALYVAGKEAVLCDLDVGGETARLGLSICYDLRFPELYRQMARAGATLLAVPAAFTARTGRDHWSVLLRARAIECGSFVLAAAQGGVHEDGRQTWGRSAVVDPWGRVVDELAHDEPDVLLADIDPAEALTARARIPNLRHGRTFGLRVVGTRAEAAT